MSLGALRPRGSLAAPSRLPHILSEPRECKEGKLVGRFSEGSLLLVAWGTGGANGRERKEQKGNTA